jgi:hypothetical protein
VRVHYSIYFKEVYDSARRKYTLVEFGVPMILVRLIK